MVTDGVPAIIAGAVLIRTFFLATVKSTTVNNNSTVIKKGSTSMGNIIHSASTFNGEGRILRYRNGVLTICVRQLCTQFQGNRSTVYSNALNPICNQFNNFSVASVNGCLKRAILFITNFRHTGFSFSQCGHRNNRQHDADHEQRQSNT